MKSILFVVTAATCIWGGVSEAATKRLSATGSVDSVTMLQMSSVNINDSSDQRFEGDITYTGDALAELGLALTGTDGVPGSLFLEKTGSAKFFTDPFWGLWLGLEKLFGVL